MFDSKLAHACLDARQLPCRIALWPIPTKGEVRARARLCGEVEVQGMTVCGCELQTYFHLPISERLNDPIEVSVEYLPLCRVPVPGDSLLQTPDRSESLACAFGSGGRLERQLFTHFKSIDSESPAAWNALRRATGIQSQVSRTAFVQSFLGWLWPVSGLASAELKRVLKGERAARQ